MIPDIKKYILTECHYDGDDIFEKVPSQLLLLFSLPGACAMNFIILFHGTIYWPLATL